MYMSEQGKHEQNNNQLNNNNNNVPKTMADEEEKKKIKDETEKILALKEDGLQNLGIEQLGEYMVTLSMATATLPEYKNSKNIENKIQEIHKIVNDKANNTTNTNTAINQNNQQQNQNIQNNNNQLNNGNQQQGQLQQNQIEERKLLNTINLIL